MLKLAYTTYLKPDPEIQAQYQAYHDAVWPEVVESFRHIGVHDLLIWQYGRQLFMVAEVNDAFDMEKGLSAYLSLDPKCQEWEAIMDDFQEAPPDARAGEKWVALKQVFLFPED